MYSHGAPALAAVYDLRMTYVWPVYSYSVAVAAAAAAAASAPVAERRRT